MKRYFFILYLFLSLGLSLLLITAAIAPAAFAEQSLLPAEVNDTIIRTVSIRRVNHSKAENKPAEIVADRSAVDSNKSHSMSRAEKRAYRAKSFAAKLDSLVDSRTFTFYPTTMQAEPKGLLRLVYADFCYMYISPTDIEVQLPVERGMSQYVTMLDFDSAGFRDYTAVKYQYEWRISFRTQSQNETYYFDIYLSTITGETVLMVQSSQIAMRYVGTILPPHADSRQK